MRAARIHAILQWGPFSPCGTYYCIISVHSHHHPSRNDKSPNRNEFSIWSAVVTSADKPRFMPRLAALIIKTEINGGDTAKSTCLFIYKGRAWYTFASVVLMIMIKTMFFTVSLVWILDKKHTFVLIASPWKIIPKVMTTVRTYCDSIYGKSMSSCCSYHVAEYTLLFKMCPCDWIKIPILPTSGFVQAIRDVTKRSTDAKYYGVYRSCSK